MGWQEYLGSREFQGRNKTRSSCSDEALIAYLYTHRCGLIKWPDIRGLRKLEMRLESIEGQAEVRNWTFPRLNLSVPQCTHGPFDLHLYCRYKLRREGTGQNYHGYDASFKAGTNTRLHESFSSATSRDFGLALKPYCVIQGLTFPRAAFC